MEVLMSRTVAIIGAGISGLLTAIRLKKAGWIVKVIEAKHIGAGSSSRTAAGIRQQFSTPETVLGMRFSVDFYKRFREEIGGELKPIIQNGYLFLLDSNVDAAMARVEMQRISGLMDVRYLTPQEAHERFPFVDPKEIQGATWCPSDGFLRPGVIYGEAASAARRLGIELYQNAPVRKVKIKDGKIGELLAGEEIIGADLFIDCTNAWSPRLSALMGAKQLPISPLKRYLWFLERGGGLAPEVLGEMPMVITPSGAYCRPESRESLMMGWAHTTDSDPSFDHDDQDTIESDYSHTGFDSHAYETWEAIASVLPPIAEFAGLAATTCGYYGTTPDHNPFLGYDPVRSNLIHLVGFSGHGAMFGPFTAFVGEQLAEAGRDIESVEIFGQKAQLHAFALEREFKHAEAMVI